MSTVLSIGLASPEHKVAQRDLRPDAASHFALCPGGAQVERTYTAIVAAYTMPLTGMVATILLVARPLLESGQH